ncbi:MAG: M23 family metallopeptidase [Bdellovibrionales bacterium]|nr:M23 family metallopeptidase [Bdellovibrionales bacterium]
MRFARLLALSVLLAACSKPLTEPEETTPHTPERVPQSDESDVKAALNAAGLGVTPLADYVFPLVGKGAYVGSAWCSCNRTIGTRPHIGQDYVAPVGSIYSVAFSNGRILSVNSQGGCGWEVNFEDSQGAVWRYLHLDKDIRVQPGQLVRQGELIGTHTQYPLPSCGSGPHLHLERHSTGDYGDEEHYETCDRTVKSCNYDPRSPLENRRKLDSLKQAAELAKGVPLPTAAAAEVAVTPRQAAATAARAPLCNPNQPQAFEVDDDFESDDNGAVPVESKIVGLKSKLSLRKSREGRMLVSISSVTLRYDNGQSSMENKCRLTEVPAKDACLARYELQVLASNGAWLSVYADQQVRNQPIVLDAGAAYCLPAGSSHSYRVVAVTEGGRSVVEDGQFEAPTP